MRFMRTMIGAGEFSPCVLLLLFLGLRSGVVPFILLQLFTLGLVMLFPELALWLPQQLPGLR
jgi:TRAP-type mannitol/chloroaromatic compound transport system permease large subunit